MDKDESKALRWLAMGIMTMVLVALCTFVASGEAQAHVTNYDGSSYSKCLDTQKGERRCDKVQRLIHRVFKYDEHRAVRNSSCESGLFKWSGKGDGSQYDGIARMGTTERAAYSGRNGWSWRLKTQVWSYWRMFKARGWQGWGEGESWGCQ